jgi:hypothetical protein
MPVFDENEGGLNNSEGLPGFTAVKGKQTGAWTVTKPPSFFKRIPFVPIILVILVILVAFVGIRVYSFEARLSDLTSEISQAKGIRGQMASLQTSFDAKIGPTNKEMHRLQSEVAHLRAEIEAMKGHQKRQAEAASQKQAAEAKKKAPAAKKPNPKDKRP